MILLENEVVTKQPVSIMGVPETGMGDPLLASGMGDLLHANGTDVPAADLRNVPTNKCNNATNEPEHGMKTLDGVGMLFVKQKVELLEAVTGCETSNSYEIQNNLGQKIMTAEEKSCCCNRQCCGQLRPFTMEISDVYGQKFLFIDRPYRCMSIPFCCCLQQMTVEQPRGRVIGHVRQRCSICRPHFDIEDISGEPIYLISGPCCQCKFCGNVKYKITSPDGSAGVGLITKEWSGLVKELFTDADKFGVTFPASLPNDQKATLLAAVFLIDFMYFEDNSAQDRPNPLT